MVRDPETRSLADGRYELTRLLGSGGMAEVWAAYDHKLGVQRAIKMLLLGRARKSATLRRRLQAEARAMARVSHPHILQMYDVGNDGEIDFVVMDLAVGGSLQDILDDQGPIEPTRCVAWMLQVLSALAAAHAAGIVHRDVKPQNILLDGNGRALLADFGIALLTDDIEDRRTRTGVAMGSMAYMPPEQRVDARSVGPAADIYAAAATLYSMLTHRSPVDLFSAGEGSRRWEGVPADFVKVIRQGTALEPDDRFTDAGDFARALMEVEGITLEALTFADVTAYPSPANTFGITKSGSTTNAGTPVPLPDRRATAAALTFFEQTWANPTLLPGPDSLYVDDAEPVHVHAEPEARARPMLLVMPIVLLALLGVGGTVWWLQAPPEPTATAITVEPARAPLPAPEPEPVVVPVPVPAPAPVVEAKPAPKPTVPTRPRPKPAATGPFGTWTGSLGGVKVTVALRGAHASLRGDVTSQLGAKKTTVPATGAYDPASRVVTLDDGDATWRLTLDKGDKRMDGRVTLRTGAVRTLSLRRSK